MNWIADPGHAWLKVKIINVFKAGVAGEISSFSYIRGVYAYLEEDRDADIYLQAIGKKCTDIRLVHTNKSSKVRSYKSWPARDVKAFLVAICA